MANRTRVSVSDAATWQDLRAVTGLGETTIKAAIINGDLPGYHVGRSYVIPREAFEAFCRNEWQPKPRVVVVQAPAPEFIRTRKAS